MKKLTVLFVLFSSFMASTVFAAEFNMRMDFGLLPVSANKTQKFLLGNNGSSTLTQISWKISGDSFTASTNCPPELAPGKSCEFVVTYWCLREGFAEGLLKIHTSHDSYALMLSGVGNRVSYPEPRPPTPRP
ncbi:hypothetical protein [Bdellovibrio sp. HCB-162]|uniref:Ig-like domain-containing protein n=1 Tax=Bdellovibrio sp. HCB-162 TaxID=3394234 RepID=UPI0039BCF04F